MLIRLLREYLRPYRSPIVVILVLQLVAVIMNLFLPTLNGWIIDKGVAQGNTTYILHTGGWMLGFSLLNIVTTVIAVYMGSRVAMGFGRDLRKVVFHKVGDFSAKELNTFGAPSLITRSTNDVQQVQMLVFMSATMMVAAPIMCIGGIFMAVREDAGLSWLLAVAVPLLAACVGRDHLADGPELPEDAEAHRRGEPGPAGADHRRQGDPGVRARTVRAQPLRRGQRLAHRDRPQHRPADGDDLPGRDDGLQHLVDRGAVVRRDPRRRRKPRSRAAHRLSQLPDTDPDVGHDGHVHVHDGAKGRGLRRPHRRGARHRGVGRAAGEPAHGSRRARGRPARQRQLRLPGCRGAGAEERDLHRAPGTVTAIIGSTGAGRPPCSR